MKIGHGTYEHLEVKLLLFFLPCQYPDWRTNICLWQNILMITLVYKRNFFMYLRSLMSWLTYNCFFCNLCVIKRVWIRYKSDIDRRCSFIVEYVTFGQVENMQTKTSSICFETIRKIIHNSSSRSMILILIVLISWISKLGSIDYNSKLSMLILYV